MGDVNSPLPRPLPRVFAGFSTSPPSSRASNPPPFLENGQQQLSATCTTTPSIVLTRDSCPTQSATVCQTPRVAAPPSGVSPRISRTHGRQSSFMDRKLRRGPIWGCPSGAEEQVPRLFRPVAGHRCNCLVH